jgi:threonine/homoserine/homoserine lactone efflux protein
MPLTISWLQFSAAVLLIEIMPGPNMLWLAALSLTEGRRAGLAATLGVSLGLALNALFTALALHALIIIAPPVENALRWAGVAIVLGLAAQRWRAPRSAVLRNPPNGPVRAFASGLALNVINTKAVGYFAVLMPPLLGGRPPTMPEAAALASISVALATAVHVAVVLGAARAHDWLSSPQLTAISRRVTALL